MKNHYYEIQFLLHIIYSNGHSGATNGGIIYILGIDQLIGCLEKVRELPAI